MMLRRVSDGKSCEVDRMFEVRGRLEKARILHARSQVPEQPTSNKKKIFCRSLEAGESCCVRKLKALIRVTAENCDNPPPFAPRMLRDARKLYEYLLYLN